MINSGGLTRRQKSVRYYLPRGGDGTEPLPKGFTDFYTDMFIQDVSTSIMPIGGNARRTGFSVAIMPPNPIVEEIVLSGLGTRDYERVLKSALSEFFRLLASEVCAMDRAIYEIVYLENADSETVGFELVYIDDAQITSKRGQLYQRVPKEVAERESVAALIPLSKEDVLVFRAPGKLAKTLRETRVSLLQLNDLALSSFASEAFRSKIPYDYGIHRKGMEVALAMATRDVGWTARGLFRERTLSYYDVHMHFLFERFKLKLREAFLATLNEGLRRVGMRMNFEGRITISGLPTTDEIDRAMAELESGSTAFTVLMEPFLRY
jgi:hypothetical protein